MNLTLAAELPALAKQSAGGTAWQNIARFDAAWALYEHHRPDFSIGVRHSDSCHKDRVFHARMTEIMDRADRFVPSEMTSQQVLLYRSLARVHAGGGERVAIYFGDRGLVKGFGFGKVGHYWKYPIGECGYSADAIASLVILGGRAVMVDYRVVGSDSEKSARLAGWLDAWKNRETLRDAGAAVNLIKEQDAFKSFVDMYEELPKEIGAQLGGFSTDWQSRQWISVPKDSGPVMTPHGAIFDREGYEQEGSGCLIAVPYGIAVCINGERVGAGLYIKNGGRYHHVQIEDDRYVLDEGELKPVDES